MRTLIVAFGLLATPALAAEQQFDLICVAKKTTVRYRIDLERGEWCNGSCGLIRKIVDATTGMLSLENHHPEFRGDDERRIEINRTTGKWYTYDYSPKFDVVPLVRDGTCQPAPFSRFPAVKF